MLVRITEYCTMNCNHCMIDASPKGKHMSIDIFKDVLKFNSEFDPMFLFISGGEPTEHPNFIEMINIAKESNFKPVVIIIASNGLFLKNNKYTNKILNLNLNIQITNDKRFYPKRINKINHKLITYEHRVRQISPFGRALKNNIPITQKYPPCFNLRSINSQSKTFKGIIKVSRQIGKFCSPSINIDGSISAAECPSCYCIGSIYMNDKQIKNNIDNMQCNKCQLYKNLDGIYREKWDYFEETTSPVR